MCRPALLNKLNMAQVMLIPTSQSIVTANKSMHIMGAVMMEIRAEKDGKKRYTRQFCYVLYIFKKVSCYI